MKTLRSLLSGTFLQNPINLFSDANSLLSTTLSQSCNSIHLWYNLSTNTMKLIANCLQNVSIYYLFFFFISKSETRFLWLYQLSIKFCLPGSNPICIIAFCNCGILKDFKYFYVTLAPGSPVHRFHFLPSTLLIEYFQIFPHDVMTQHKSVSTSQTSPLGHSSLSGWFTVIWIYWFQDWLLTVANFHVTPFREISFLPLHLPTLFPPWIFFVDHHELLFTSY